MNYDKPILPEFYTDCSRITEGYEKLWGRWSIDSQLLHVVTEICEVRDVIRNKNDKYGVNGSVNHLAILHDEISDVFLTAFATANHLGLSIEQLNFGILKKMKEVEKRLQDAQKEAKDFVDNQMKKISGENNV